MLVYDIAYELVHELLAVKYSMSSSNCWLQPQVRVLLQQKGVRVCNYSYMLVHVFCSRLVL